MVRKPHDEYCFCKDCFDELEAEVEKTIAETEELLMQEKEYAIKDGIKSCLNGDKYE